MEFIQVRYSQVATKALLIELASRYLLKEPICCELFQNGLNDVYKVTAGDIVYYLRISLTGVHTLSDFEDEAAVLLRLHQDGIKVAVPIICRDDKYVWPIHAPEGIRYAILFSEAQNKPSNDEKAKYRNLGYTIAKMHQSIDNSNLNLTREAWDEITLVERPLALIKPYLSHRDNDYSYIRDCVNDIWSSVRQYEKIQPYYGLCHGDIQPNNFYFIDNEPVMFDFDCMGFGWRSYDLAVFAMNMGTQVQGFFENDIWKSFIEGYASVRQLEPWEHEIITGFAALHTLRVMWHHAKLREQNSGSHFYCTDTYFNALINILKSWYDQYKLR